MSVSSLSPLRLLSIILGTVILVIFLWKFVCIPLIQRNQRLKWLPFCFMMLLILIFIVLNYILIPAFAFEIITGPLISGSGQIIA